MSTTFELNDGAIWAWRAEAWTCVCSGITPTCVYRDPSGQYFELGLIDGAGREFRLKATQLFSRDVNDLRRALRAEGIKIFDLDLTAMYLRSTIPTGPCVDDPNILPTWATGANAEFRKQLLRLRGHAHVV